MNDPKPTRLEGIRDLGKLAPVVDSDALDETPPQDLCEVPVDPRAGPDASVDFGVTYGFAPVTDGAVRRCRNALLASLIDVSGEGVWGVFYSRDNNFFSKHRSKLPDDWTRRNIEAAVASLEQYPELVISRRVAPQNPRSPDYDPKRSALAVGPGLIAKLVTRANTASQRTFDRVILRDARGRQKTIAADDPVLVRTTSFFERYDELLARTHFEIRSGVQWRSASIGVVQVKGGVRYIRLCDYRAVRIFNRTLTRGGRLYRPWWLNLPKALRASIHINGEAVVEYDYRACHFRLAYFALSDAKAPPLPHDPYSLPDAPPEMRPIVKRAVQIMLNARTYRSALGAIAAIGDVGTLAAGDNWDDRLDIAEAVISRIKSAYPAMAPFWHSGCGSALQYVDSEIVMACLENLLTRGIVALGVHDSIIVAHQHRNTLVGIMEATFDEIGPAMARRHLKYFRDEFARKQRKAATERADESGALGEDPSEPSSRVKGETTQLGSLTRVSAHHETREHPGLRGHVLTKREKKQGPLEVQGQENIGESKDRTVSPPKFGDVIFPAPHAPRGQSASTASRVEVIVRHRDYRAPEASFFADLLAVIVDRRRITTFMLRALLLDRTNRGLTVDAAGEFVSHWLVETQPISGVAYSSDDLQEEVNRLRARRPLWLSGTSAAKLCGVRKRDVTRLGLQFLVPRRVGKTPARMISHKIALTNGKVSRVVDVKRAAPWGSGSRSSWFEAVKSPVDRQRIALAAMIEAGDAQGVISAYGRYAERVAARDLIKDKNRIAADALFAALAPLFNSAKGKALMAEADTAAPERITGSESSAWNSVQAATDLPAATAAISEGLAAAPQAVRQPEDVPAPDAPDTGDANHKAPSAPAPRKGFLARLVGFGSGKSDGQQ